MPDVAYCEPEDVRLALQERELDGAAGPLETDAVEAAIGGVSSWLLRTSRHHWYDSTAASTDLVSTTALEQADLVLDVPSSPHRQDGQLFASASRAGRGTVRYPNTTAGPYVRIRLPRAAVQSVDRLLVRDRGGGATDWVADASINKGRGEDYYLQRDETSDIGVSYLYLRADSIGSRTHFDHLLTVDITFGWDDAQTSWGDVKRGVAQLAAAQLIVEDDLMTAIPDSGQLVNLDHRAKRLTDAALDTPGALAPYMEAPVR